MMKQVLKLTVCVLVTGVVLLSSCKKEHPYPAFSVSDRPVANAGPDQTITLPTNSIALDGSASKPGKNKISTYFWHKVLGSSQVTMSSTSEPVKQVTNLASGVYQFVLTVTDAAGLYSRDTVQVAVFPVALHNDTINVISGTATLTSFGSLSQARTVVPATAGDKLVFGGGYLEMGGNWEPTPTVDIYNLAADTWSTTQLSETRRGLTVATVGNKILYAGGNLINGAFTSRVDIYDASGNSWSTANLSMARSQMTTAVAGTKAFFAGWDYSEFTTRVDIYDASSNNWSIAELSEARTGMSVIAAGNKVLFAGGYRKYDGWFENGYDFSATVDIYDIATNSWSRAELKEARSRMAAAVVGNKVLFAGGHYITDLASGQGSGSKWIDIYDASTNTWSATSLDEPLSGMVAATTTNKVLFGGGGSNKVYIYDALLNHWSQTVLSQPSNDYSTATLGSKVLFFTRYPNNNRMDIYDASANTWSSADLDKSLNSFPIVAGNSVYIGGGQVHTIGSSADLHFTSNVWKLEF